MTPAVEAIVRRCLEPRPGRRYQSARELHEDLERHLDHRPLLHTPEPSWREAREVVAAAPAADVGQRPGRRPGGAGGVGGLLWSVWSRGSDLEARAALAHLEDELKRLPAMLAAATTPPPRRPACRRCESLAPGGGCRPPAGSTARRRRGWTRRGESGCASGRGDASLWLWGHGAGAGRPRGSSGCASLNDRARVLRPPAGGGAAAAGGADPRDDDADGAERLLASLEAESPLDPLRPDGARGPRPVAQAMPLLQEALAGDSATRGCGC